ncbi:MAG: histidine kinase [Bacteroidetes bacterium]|nr:histidine kinase [Bacteroidota bacterium]
MFFFPKPHHPLPVGHSPHSNFLIPLAFGNSVLMHVVILLASIGLRLNQRWKLTEQEKLQSELALLKSQVNPHFLFNTLNGIYAATLGKADNASEMIIKLSDIMRYTISEAHLDKVPLQKEINYISSYIELQKLRLSSKVSLEYTVKGEVFEFEMAPLLLIPFVENAFKYGVNPEQDSSILVFIGIDKGELHLLVYNKKVDIERTIQETTGLGIENTRLRLNLIYPGKHKLNIEETESSYSISLYINLI